MTNIRHRATGIIKKNGKALLFHRIKHGHDYFMFPGGGVEDGETIEQALERELSEELELEIKKYRPLFVVENIEVPKWATIHHDQLQNHHYFLIEDYIGVPNLGGPEKAAMNEQDQYHIVWLGQDELEDKVNIVPREGTLKLLDIFNSI